MIYITFVRLSILFALLLPAASPAFGLGVGDPAPPIKAEAMVKGEAVDLSKGMHVVEFWATWCGPCKASIPHLSEMAKTYRGKVDFTSVDVREQGDDQLGQVKKFVATMGDRMDCNVAFDGEARAMYKSFLETTTQGAIPQAFLVKDGRILWIGHPMDGLDAAIDGVLAGTFDIAAAKAKFDQAAARDVVVHPIAEAFRAKNYEAALAAIDKAEAAYPDLKEDLERWRLEMLVRTGSPEGKAAARALLEGEQGNDMYLLYIVARAILDPTEKVPDPDYQTALRLAERSAQMSEMKDSMILNTYALALFKTGNKKKALEMQTRAVELAKAEPIPDAARIKEMEDRLAQYRQPEG